MFENNKRKVKPFYAPPTLILTQALSALYLGAMTHWTKLPSWLLKGKNTLPTAAGAVGIGCIGFPNHPVWEMTTACNLRCKQCHASAGKNNPDELTTEEGIDLLHQVAEIPEFRMFTFAGGEPLVRSDIFELIACARDLGFEVSVATNGTLITNEVARRLRKLGVVNIAIGLNANDKAVHESITRTPGSFDKTKQGIYHTRELGMNLQINTTVMKENISSIPSLLDFASEVDADIVLLYQLLPEGRGDNDMELSPSYQDQIAKLIASKQRQSTAAIQPVCSPQYWAYLVERTGGYGWRLNLAEKFFKGCIAGKGLCYVKPNGDIWPCPFVPVTAGNIRQSSLRQIWSESEVLLSLRDRKNLKGKCGTCLYMNVCGGCRGRAYAHLSDYLGEDPFCFLYKPRPSMTAAP